MLKKVNLPKQCIQCQGELQNDYCCLSCIFQDLEEINGEYYIEEEEETEDIYGLKACEESVKYSVEKLNYNPIHLLGEYELRAKQDPFFNKTMITALYKYIEEHEIKWDDNRFHPKK